MRQAPTDSLLKGWPLGQSLPKVFCFCDTLPRSHNPGTEASHSLARGYQRTLTDSYARTESTRGGEVIQSKLGVMLPEAGAPSNGHTETSGVYYIIDGLSEETKMWRRSQTHEELGEEGTASMKVLWWGRAWWIFKGPGS